MRLTAYSLIFSLLAYFPSVTAFAEPNSKKMGYATEQSAQDGQFIHPGKPGQLLIRVHMLGSLTQQGIHYFPEGTDILDALLYAGGVMDTTKIDSIQIRRNGVKDIVEMDLTEIIEDGREIPKVNDGDIVNVPFNWRRDISTISLIAGFLTAATGFIVSVIALNK